MDNRGPECAAVSGDEVEYVVAADSMGVSIDGSSTLSSSVPLESPDGSRSPLRVVFVVSTPRKIEMLFGESTPWV